MQPPQTEHQPHEPLPGDNSTRTKRSDRLHDQRTHSRHPNEDRLTEADLDQHERERLSTHAQLRSAQ